MRNTEYSKKERACIFTSPGSPVHEVYTPSVRSDGSIDLKVSGQEDTDAIIHSYRESTDLKTLLARFANGDTSALNKYQPFYADVSAVPRDHRSALEAVLNAEAAFTALPVSIKEQFDNDWRKWLAQAGTESWFAAMDDLIVRPASAEASEPAEKLPE